ncbi:Sua5/YciO/YrdC/YwlC family protein [Thiospirillum jenense]|uniref:Threonylcarbamoyl-AMP synthase n=1 Tax=Thiospirillum jenense TaxID=1653858 RepID=A0A839HGH9_9GAMM|nr:Sua5/YciO/YrdC/YwlC family protein [Thiospirillum jenense]MBB1126187.1 Sua5/YciO/YrdC/YwlC family protein [Thiospirillum jenense]
MRLPPLNQNLLTKQQVGSHAHALRLARQVLTAGGVIAYPTEAVYGLGCDPRNGDAVNRLLALKQRTVSKGLILIAADFAALQPFVLPLNHAQMAAIHASWPGANTWLLPAHPSAPRWLTGDHAQVAVRVSAHPLVLRLCDMWGGALISTSANQAGRRPARTALQVRQRLAHLPQLIINAPCGGARRPSVIRDGMTGRVIRN